MPTPTPAPAPRELADLPFVDYLEKFSGRLQRDETYDTVLFEECDFEEPEAGNARFSESAFSTVTFGSGRVRRARFNDVWFHTFRFVGTDLVETNWLDAELISGALAGVEMFTSEMRRVTFHKCKFDSVNLRGAQLREVVFSDCVIRDVDFGGATLSTVAFPGSSLVGARFDKARMEKVDLRGATALEIADSSGGLAGATISTTQLLDLAPLLAKTAGIEVKDR